jgi:long-chain acyl-CoA synthetase
MKKLHDIYRNICDQSRQKHPYAIFSKDILTYGELLERIKHLSGLFQQQCKLGDRVVLCSTDDELIITVTAAAFLNGMTLIVLSAEQKISRLQSLIQKSTPTLIIADEILRADLEHSNCAFFSIQPNRTGQGNALLERFKKSVNTGWKSALKNLPEREPLLEAPLDNYAFINFSSGTTGDPKGICITVRNVLCHMQTLCRQFSYNTDSRILNNMLLSHADGLLQGPVLALYCGGVVARPCSMDVQHLEEYLNSVHKLRITHLITVPTIFSFIDRLTAHNDYFDSADFRHLITVAGMMNPDLWQRLEQRFQQRVSNIYGLTETVAGGIFCGPDDATYRIGTVGKPLDMQIRVVDSDGRDLPTGAEGELWLRGDNVFHGYWDNALKTAEASEGNWFKTGDIACVDEAGFVRITGRLKELIISGGFNVHPAEVNEALLKHPAIVDVATLGIEDEQWQEIVVSAVVTTDDTVLDEKTLINFCRQYLEEKKVPKKIVFLPNLPKGDAGKVKIEILKSQLNQTQGERESEFTLTQLFELAANIFKTDATYLSLSTRAGSIPGWDSLGHLTFLLAVEEAAKVQLTAQDIMATESLSELWQLIKRKQA